MSNQQNVNNLNEAQATRAEASLPKSIALAIGAVALGVPDAYLIYGSVEHGLNNQRVAGIMAIGYAARRVRKWARNTSDPQTPNVEATSGTIPPSETIQ